jgi:hypothetical protein
VSPTPRRRRSGPTTSQLFLERAHDPGSQVANVDHLDGIRWRAGRHHLITCGETNRPVREAIGGVTGSDDEAGPNHGDLPRHLFFRGAFARGLQRTIGPLVDLLDRRVRELADRAALVDARLRRLVVDRDGRDEDVLLCVVKNRGRFGDLAREIAGRVDDDVPGSSLERVELARLPIAVELLDVRKELRVRLATIEERQRVPTRLRDLHDLGAEERGSAEDEDALGRFARRRRDAGPGGGCGARRALRSAGKTGEPCAEGPEKKRTARHFEAFTAMFGHGEVKHRAPEKVRGLRSFL